MIDDVIRKHALRNALDHGKAVPNAVVGKVIAEFPECKKDMKSTMKSIVRILSEVNGLKKEEIEKEIKKYSFSEKKKQEKGIVLEGGKKGEVVTRFPPEPSGYPHIGHAKAAYLDWTAARVYDGKFMLRFDDTNPEAESQEYVGAIKEALEWLGIDWDSESYSSDNMEMFYDYAEKMLGKGDAYVCTCPTDTIRLNRSNQTACPCRSLGNKERLKRWKGMLGGEYNKGEAIVRFSGDMSSLNTALRDPTLLRIIDSEHYRQKKKYRIWPSYDFAAPILDSVEGVTHAMRTKEYELRDELYNAILESLSLRKPKIVEFSRLSIKGMPVSKRLLKPLIKDGIVNGWDDPRLPTISALRRRGIKAEAIKSFVLKFGLGKTESNPTMEVLLVENRRLLDPISERYFFVSSPVKLKVISAPSMAVRLKKHPDKELGERVVETTEDFFISSKDAENLEKGTDFRLKDLYNVKLVEKGVDLVAEFVGKEVGPGPKIQWVASNKNKPVHVKILVPQSLVDDSGSVIEDSLSFDEGYCESSCSELKEGQIVQFERYGFCRLDEKKEMRFIFVNP